MHRCEQVKTPTPTTTSEWNSASRFSTSKCNKFNPRTVGFLSESGKRPLRHDKGEEFATAGQNKNAFSFGFT
jgi:hypothetical protein